MPRILTTGALFLTLFLLLSGSASAQRFAFGIGVDYVMPTGDFSFLAEPGYGVSARIETRISPDIKGIGTVSYLMFAEESTVYSYDALPINIGIKVAVSQGLYLAPQLGIYNFYRTFKYGSISTQTTSTDIGFAFGVGYDFFITRGLYGDLMFHYNNADDFSYIGVRFGLRFRSI